MAGYTEKEMLILSNFLYVDASLEEGTISQIIERYKDENGEFTEQSVSSTYASGGIDNKGKAALFKEMEQYISEHPEFGNLSRSRSINDGGIRGICFTSPSDSDPIVVFRGTGGSPEAWSDDFVGGVVPETKMMKTAHDFIKYECGNYENITVTGHSKGGNMSMYVAVKCGDKISKCVSFDGQGFNDEFMKNNADAIAANKGKIKSVSAYNDFVNILLNPVAGKCVYADNNAQGPNAHSSMSLLISNKYDAEGNIISMKQQSGVAKSLKSVTDEAVSYLSKQPPGESMAFSVFAGCFTSAVLSVDSFSDAAKVATGTAWEINNILNDKLIDAIKDLIPEELMLRFKNEYISETNVMEACNMFTEGMRKINGIKNDVMGVSGELDYNLVSKIYVDISLSRVCDRMSRISDNLRFMSEELELITSKYEQKDSLIASHF